ncbi:3-isopropylmalate dehydratase large subunit [Roseovarius pacificus]|uniref:3-isopropylmalate dehydratase large subunit n=1 Tax=Roseovarius pacificus TaxID=337701 RepID=UPI002A18CDA8|nr:3-isopropylmalate dehydratase large subunit [Roseovarius pacificus]
MSGLTAFDKIWNAHAIRELPDGYTLLYVDRHLTHEVTSPRAYSALEKKNIPVHRPNLTLAVEDHILSTEVGRDHETYKGGTDFILAQRRSAARHGIKLIDVHNPDQGIVHVIAHELGIALPGMTLACGDSHTCTLGGMGTVAFGIGTSQIEQVLATQAITLRKPLRMRVSFNGHLGVGVTPKDMILYLISQLGVDAGAGYAIEFAGSAIRDLSMEGRFTICNMSAEMGARIGFVAPDSKTFEYLAGRKYSPKNQTLDAALEHWATLCSDEDAEFDREFSIDCGKIEPQITWGTTPGQSINISEPVPDPSKFPDERARNVATRALDYMALSPNSFLLGLPIENVFIGSCNNSRLEDLRAAASIIKGRKVANGVRAIIVPGSSRVRHDAEREGLSEIFKTAGFEWRESACSMCAAVNGDKVPDGERCVSTSNRNFEGRQGRNSRTHLASPLMAAAAAVTGRITDVRALLV